MSMKSMTPDVPTVSPAASVVVCAAICTVRLVEGITVAASPAGLLLAVKLSVLPPAPVKASISGAPASSVSEVGNGFPLSVTVKDKSSRDSKVSIRGRRDRSSWGRERRDRRDGFALRKKGRAKLPMFKLLKVKSPGGGVRRGRVAPKTAILTSRR